MTKDFKRFYVSRAMFLGATMFLASIGMASANPSTDTFGSNEPNPVVASPQQAKHTIKGVVEDQFGPIAGANVVEKGTTNGTITDMDGNFSLEVAPNSILIVSFIGYKEQQIPVNSQKTVTIKLTEDSQALEEVVVVGYGTQKKVNLSGSVTSVNVSEMAESRPLTNISTALAGTAPGVQITSSNNIPSNNGDADIKVRGQGTLNNSSPLVIIDGVEGSLNSVSPQDVETVSVLKDAASSAIYGSRAANGVILITTKSGKSGKMKLDYTGYVSFQTLDKPYDVVSDYASYMEYLNEGMTNSNKPAPFSQNVINLWREKSKDPNGLNEYGMPNYLAYPNSDIFDVYETGVSHQHNLSASGGSEKITYYTSFNYLNNPGILENCGYERFSLRANIDSQIKDWLKLGVNLSGYTANTTPVSENIKDIYTYGLTGGNPGIAYLDDQNRLGINANAEDDPQNATNNPYNRLRNTTGNVQTNTLKTRLYAILTPLKGLTIQGSYTYDYYDKFKESKPNFVPMYNFQTNTLYTDGVGQTSIYNYNEKTFRNFMDATIRYERNFFDDRLSTNLMVGASQEQYKRQYFSATRKDLIDPSLGVIDGAIGESSSTGNITEWAMRSYFGRLNLGWDDKYLFEANLRADGSSRFLADNRWGYFPSFSAAWRISEEEFMKNISWLDNLKIRASYGSLGNNTLGSNRDNDGNYTSQSLYAQTNYVLARAVAMGLSQTAIANAALTWETTYITNVGLDYNVLGNRLSGSIEFFNKKTDGILIDLPAPMVHGNATIPKQNAAQVTNKGLEITAHVIPVKTRDWMWTLDANISFNRNKIGGLNADQFSDVAWGIESMFLRRNGHRIGTLYGYVEDGFYDNEAEVRADPYYRDATPSKVKSMVGQVKYKNLDDDPVIDDRDKTIIGDTNPDYQYGITSTFTYKNFTLSFFFQGTQGNDILNVNLKQFDVAVGSGNMPYFVFNNRWTPENRAAAKWPRADGTFTRAMKASDRYIVDGSYLRCKNISLSYNWAHPVKFVESINIVASITNLFTISGYEWYDPDVNAFGSDPTRRGVDMSSYPSARTFNLGIQLAF